MLSELKRSLSRALDLPLILGVAATVGFYAIITQPAFHDTLLHRYTTENPVEYVIAMMFFWGVTDIVLKTLSFPREKFALREKWLPARSRRENVSTASTLLSSILSKPRWLVESRIGERLVKVLEHVVENGTDEDYRDHLKSLSDKAYDATHSRYGLVRFVIMVSPILGFLGTVVHFGSALSGMSVKELEVQLPGVVSEMGEAFNTTTVALATSMTMMFGLFLCERYEHRIDAQIDRFVENELLNRFEVNHENLTPFLDVIQSANRDAMRTLATALERQNELAAQAFETLCERIDERQQQQSNAWTKAIVAMQQQQSTLESGHENRIRELIGQMENRQTQHLTQLQTFLQDIALLRGDVKGVGTVLQSISHGEGKLLELQEVLTNNLQVLRETQQIDEALHGLSAAIHLLTARHRQGGGDSLAA